MVGSFGEVLVMDWGLAKILREHSLSREETLLTSGQEVNSESDSIQSTVITGHGTVMGTPGYMPPEQARGETEKIDVRSDIFSLGVRLKFIAIGGAPGQSAALPRPLLAICVKATAESPNARYAHVSELAADVSLYLDGLRVRAYAENFLERFRRLHTDFY
jgi:serine/threonine protein kinase